MISVSVKNSKMGKGVGNFSLPPVVSCPAICAGTCSRRCYARKRYCRFPSVRNAWDRNLAIVQESPDDFREQMTEYLEGFQGKYFRVHVSGDFVSQEYFRAWLHIARDFPGIQFLAFTKCYDISEGERLPDNFSLVYSLWEGIPADIVPKGSPIAYAGNGSNIPADTWVCPGSCDGCKRCYTLGKDGSGYNAVYFHYH